MIENIENTSYYFSFFTNKKFILSIKEKKFNELIQVGTPLYINIKTEPPMGIRRLDSTYPIFSVNDGFVYVSFDELNNPLHYYHILEKLIQDYLNYCKNYC